MDMVPALTSGWPRFVITLEAIWCYAHWLHRKCGITPLTCLLPRSIARRRMAQGHCVRSVAIVPGVPEVEDPVVSHQDIATLANLAVPGLRSGSGKDRIVRDRFLIHQAERGLLRPGRLRLCWRENGEPEGHGHKGCAQKRKSICDHGSFVPDWLSHVGEPSQCLVRAEPQPRLSS